MAEWLSEQLRSSEEGAPRPLVGVDSNLVAAKTFLDLQRKLDGTIREQFSNSWEGLRFELKQRDWYENSRHDYM